MKSARKVMLDEAAAITAAAYRLGESFPKAVAAIVACKGRVVCSGIGKSGHVARKLAATFACTGTPAVFLHAGDAAHGDAGMIADGDVVVLISNSGETREIVELLLRAYPNGAERIAITKPNSTLWRGSAYRLDASVAVEACPLGLSPSSSCAVATALGDALAFAVAEARGFKSSDFARLHPGGELGRKLQEIAA